MDQSSRRKLTGVDRELELYQLGLAGKKPELPIDVQKLEALAKARIEPAAYDYVAGAAGAEQTLRANLEAFFQWRIVPRMMRDVAERDLSVELLGTRLPAPILLGPVGVQGIVRPEGEMASAAAAASVGLPFTLSTVASHSIEDIAKTGGPRWFQLYWGKDEEVAASMLRRAERAGYSAVLVTLDTSMLAWRPRDLDRSYLPFQMGLGLANYTSDPAFCSRLSKPPKEDPAAAVRQWATTFSNPTLTWPDLKKLRQWTKLPIIPKGILHPEDAEKALDVGADAILVSNHGGRQVDGAVAALDALPRVVEAVRGRVPVLFDSGIRSGADVFKAIALGARAVLIGRLYMWGLGAGGEQGVRDVLQNLLADADLTLALSGYRNFTELNAACLTRV